MKFKAFDFIFIALFLSAAVLSVAGAARKQGSRLSLYVKTPCAEYEYNLNQNATLEFEGVLGTTTVEIFDKKAHVVSSPCDNKICVNAGFIHKAGDFAACLPNGVIIRINGKDEEYDAY